MNSANTVDVAIDTGDTVLHVPTGETWRVAIVDGDHLYWVGWPAGAAYLQDCELIEKSSPEDRMKFLCALAGIEGDDHRAVKAREILNSMER